MVVNKKLKMSLRMRFFINKLWKFVYKKSNHRERMNRLIYLIKQMNKNIIYLLNIKIKMMNYLN